jgi:hypothetical protein
MRCIGGKVKNALNLKTFAVVAFLGTGLLLSGCKSAPDLTQANALALIQAKYDATPATGATIMVNNQGMLDGITAKYWTRTTIYPNKIWADFTLTADGKKAIKLSNGGDVIQWRPESAVDKQYALVVTTVAANHLKAHDLGAIQDDPGGKGVSFTESVDLTGVPAPLQNIAHNPGNRLSTKRQAEFVLADGAWKLQSIL